MKTKIYTTAVAVLCLLTLAGKASSQTIYYKRIVQPAVNVTGYSQIAVGDIVGPSGSRTQSSMNLSDELTTGLMAKGSHEVLDRTVLMQLSKSGAPDAAIVDESIITSLGERYQSAILIVGRIQSENIYQELKKNPQSIVVNGCHTTYYYESSGELTVQLRLLDVKTAKLIHAEAVSVPMVYQTKEGCEVPGKLSETEIMKLGTAALKEKILNTIFPYEVKTQLDFASPFLGNPFKQLSAVAVNFETGNNGKGLEVLESYTTSPSIKQKHRHFAYYNYGLGLLADHQLAAAKESFIKAYELNPYEVAYSQLISMMDQEIAYK